MLVGVGPGCLAGPDGGKLNTQGQFERLRSRWDHVGVGLGCHAGVGCKCACVINSECWSMKHPQMTQYLTNE